MVCEIVVSRVLLHHLVAGLWVAIDKATIHIARTGVPRPTSATGGVSSRGTRDIVRVGRRSSAPQKCSADVAAVQNQSDERSAERMPTPAMPISSLIHLIDR